MGYSPHETPNLNNMILKEISFYQAKNLWNILLCSN